MVDRLLRVGQSPCSLRAKKNYGVYGCDGHFTASMGKSHNSEELGFHGELIFSSGCSTVSRTRV